MIPPNAQAYVETKTLGREWYKRDDDTWWYWSPTSKLWGKCSKAFSLEDKKWLNRYTEDGIIYWVDPLPEENEDIEPYKSAEAFIKLKKGTNFPEWALNGRYYLKQDYGNFLELWKPEGAIGGPYKAECWAPAGSELDYYLKNYSSDGKLYALVRNTLIRSPLKEENTKKICLAALNMMKASRPYLSPSSNSAQTNIETNPCFEAPKPRQINTSEAAAVELHNAVLKELPKKANSVAEKKANVDINQVALTPGMVVTKVFSNKKYVLLSKTEEGWLVHSEDGKSETYPEALLKICKEDQPQASKTSLVFISILFIAAILTQIVALILTK
jgi:hypothetical protein